jgi:hypothetical protein
MANVSWYITFRNWLADQMRVKPDRAQQVSRKRRRRIFPQSLTIGAFLLTGVAVAAITPSLLYLRNYLRRTEPPTSGAGIVEYRNLDVTSGEVTTNFIETQKASSIVLFGRVSQPQNGTATVAVEGLNDQTGLAELKRLSVFPSWTRFPLNNGYTKVRIHVQPWTGPNVTAATHVDLLVYFSP